MTEPAAEAKNYKDTLNLPKTSFDMKANLTQREPKMVAQWAADKLYEKIRATPHPKGKWILHDGPPYANGDIHMGHLINKVLKDIVVKFRTMQGHDAPYVPGWDCHGLPIESAIQKELGPKFRELSKDDLRKRCQEYALKYVKLQGDSFQRLGIFGSFDKPYLTLDPKYEAGILEVLAELVQRDLVYRQKKPVHWCTNDRTALAEAELEYASKKDTSVYVLFELSNHADWWQSAWGLCPKVAYLMVWTTTPWTIPANRGVAVHPKIEYVPVRLDVGGGRFEHVFVAAQRAGEIQTLILTSRFANASELEKYNLVESKQNSVLVDTSWVERATITGEEWCKLRPSYIHPLDPSRLQPIVLADYVTLEDGTGLVHTAPGHGKEDYATGQKYHLETYNPVLPDGRYDDTVPEFLRGKLIWDANQLIIDKLKETGALFHAQEFSHEYPHCWRCKKPTIQRATEQWFIAVDREFGVVSEPKKTIRERARSVTGWSIRDGLRVEELKAELSEPEWERQDRLEKQGKQFHKLTKVDRTAMQNEIDAISSFYKDQKVNFVPPWGGVRLAGMLDTRPDWCISRQRSWGVPIPAFFRQSGELAFSTPKELAEVVSLVADHFREHGADSWYTDSPAELLGMHSTNPERRARATALRLTTATNFDDLEKGMDILDVWFESGASHHAVLECTHPELGYPANMYLEGSDQHRGWFQSSLLEASGYKSEPPFKQVLTHGFVVDDQGKKYSKSSGNYVPVEKLLTQHGADVLRLWVSSVDYQNDIKFSANNITSTSEAYRKIRNTMRYLLGNLYDYNPYENIRFPRRESIDAWMWDRVVAWGQDLSASYDRYEFHNVFKLLYEFCNVEISSLYAKAIKDRLYCELPDSPRRRAAQTVCYGTLLRLIDFSAPILVFTAEEAWQAVRQLPGCSEFESSIHLVQLEKLVVRDFTSTRQHWSLLLPLIEKGNKQLDDLKRSIGLGNPLDAEAVIILPKVEDEVSKLIADYGPEIEDALGVGYHRVEHGEMGGGWDIKIEDTRQKYASCARSWKRRPDVGTDKDFPDLSARDAAVVRALRPKP